MAAIMVVEIRELVGSCVQQLDIDTLFRFLWRVDPHDNNDLRVYKWTGRNDYVALCDKDGFSFGGGYVIFIHPAIIHNDVHSQGRALWFICRRKSRTRHDAFLPNIRQ